MRNPSRIQEVLNLVKFVWNQNPDLRLTQLIENACSLSPKNSYHIEDDELYGLLKRYYDWETGEDE